MAAALEVRQTFPRSGGLLNLSAEIGLLTGALRFHFEELHFGGLVLSLELLHLPVPTSLPLHVLFACLFGLADNLSPLDLDALNLVLQIPNLLCSLLLGGLERPDLLLPLLRRLDF